MKMKIKNFNQFKLNEKSEFFYSALKDTLSDDIINLKQGVLDILDENIKEKDLLDLKKFINIYTKEPENNQLIGLTDDADVFDFYLKYQSEIDSLCEDIGYYTQIPKNNNITSLYDFIIKGTMESVLETMERLKKEIK